MICSVETCPRSVYCRGWCQAHYRRWYVGGKVRADVPLRRENGTGSLDRGYVRHWSNGRLEYEHRLVKGAVKGDGLTVHHENEVKDDNRPENLVMMTRAAHTLLHLPRLGTGAKAPCAPS